MIGVMLFTYDRLECARRTLDALRSNLYTPEPLWMHIADDGSSQEYRDELLSIAHAYWGENVSVTNTERKGYGASYNAATQIVHHIADIVLPLEDDWELIRPLDITSIVQVLRDGKFGCVRLGYIGYTQELRGKFIYSAGKHWLAFDPDSPEPHVFAGGPRLETVEYEQSIGPWPEGLAAGITEFQVAHIRASRIGVAWPVELVNVRGDAFVHIGSREVKDEPLAVGVA